ncbi:MAG: amidohydrolase family protein, partial [Gemmatimonadales bacterium]
MRNSLLCAVALSTLVAPTTFAQVAVRGETVHTMSGPPIQNGVVLIGRNGKIERVGPAASVSIPSGYRTLSAKVVTPGLIDAHTVVGLAGYLNQPHDQDQLDRSNAIQPELRAFDAYNAEEALVEYLRTMGVTTLHTGHGPGALMSGQTMIVKTRGRNVGEALVDSVTMVAMTLGPEVSQNFAGRPGTRGKGISLIRSELIK